MPPLLVLAEFTFTPEGDAEFQSLVERTLAEVRSVEGCLHAVLWTRPGHRYQFSTLWADAEAVTRWVENEFHKGVLMPGFRTWCTEGYFGEYGLAADHARARKCASCGRWSPGQPGWNEANPQRCTRCGAELERAAEG